MNTELEILKDAVKKYFATQKAMANCPEVLFDSDTNAIKRKVDEFIAAKRELEELIK